MNADISIYTLGHLVVERNGVVVENFISAKAALLLVYLAMHPGEHSRKKLAALLWSETHDEQALKNLRTVLSSIRQQVDNALIIERDSLAINSGITVTVDARQFEVGCEKAFKSPGTLDLSKAMQYLIDLYQGDFLEGIVVRDAELLEPWIYEKQRQLQGLYRRLLFEFVALSIQRSTVDIGLHYAWKLVSLDPLWDAALRQLMILLTVSNRSNEALVQYERFVRLVDEELGAEPDDETTALFEQIRSGKLEPAPAAPKPTIVLPDMPFVEPLEAINIAQRMLGTPQCRLLTIFGISGIGKTALVTQLAFHRQHLYADGAYFIALKRTHTARDLPFLIAAAVGMDFSGTSDYHTLGHIVIETMKQRRLLLVLDNYEIVLPETGFIEQILEEAPYVQVVITSQMPLNLFREWLLPMTGLRVPPSDDKEPEAYEAVRLFELTAQRSNPRFNLQSNLAGVAEICRLVDGLPLAIVIAAGWAQILPIHKIIENIQEGQEFILPLQQSLPPHHQSMEMMLEYTWNTLNEAEQYGLTSMSIFLTTFAFEEVEQICAVDISVLFALIQRSLLQKFDDKYRMHQVVWRHARKKLLYSDQRDALGARYLAFYERLLENLKANSQLHDYLVSIELQYASIWNYDWMTKSFQPQYLLSMSQHLMVYWGISRMDAVPGILASLETIQREPLTPEYRRLHSLQLARLYLLTDQFEKAAACLNDILREDLDDVTWNEIALIYYFYGMLFYPIINNNAPNAISGPESIDLRFMIRSQLKLAMLFLDTGEMESADETLAFITETIQTPLHRAPIVAVRGSIAAAARDNVTAARYFIEALHDLDNQDEPLLIPSIKRALARVSIAQD